MSDTKDEDPSKKNKGTSVPPSQKRVVVTYGMKPKDEDNEDIPAEILPHTPVVVVKSPVDIGSPQVTPNLGAATTTLKGQIHPNMADDISPQRPHVSSPPPPPPPVSPRSASSEEGSPPSYQGPITESKTSAGGSSGLALFLSMVSTIAVVGLTYFAYISQKQLADLQAQSQNDKLAVSNLLTQAKQSVGQFEAIRDSNLKEREALKTLQQELEHSQARFIALRGNRDWVLSEVNYLISMANERLQVAKDIPTAIAQLKVADQRLTTLADPTLIAVKTAIASDIAKLLNITQIDKQALWVQINALSDLITKLQFKILGTAPKQEDKNTLSLSSWQTALRQSWDEIKTLIKITRIEENPIPASFTQEEQAQILRTLELLSEQAQWAVLQGDNTIYQDSLSTLEKYIKSYFLEDTDQTTLLNRIQQLQQQPVDSVVPVISDSLKTLSQAIVSKQE